MVKKSTRPAASQPDLASAIQALREATRALTTSTSTSSHDPGASAAGQTPPDHPPHPDAATAEARGISRGDSPRPSPANATDPEARAFYERLEQTGQLADVTDDTDLSKLPPRITHVRRRDGTIERIGYS